MFTQASNAESDEHLDRRFRRSRDTPITLPQRYAYYGQRVGCEDTLSAWDNDTTPVGHQHKDISMNDQAEVLRCQRLVEINAEPGSREALEAQHGQVWDTAELRNDFSVLGFAALFVIVRRKSDGVRGSLEFQHNPRFHFNFQPE